MLLISEILLVKSEVTAAVMALTGETTLYHLQREDCISLKAPD